MSTVPGSQTDLVLNPGTEGEQSTTKINTTEVCFPTLDQPGLRFNLFIKSYKIPPMANVYPGILKDGKD